MTAAFLHLGIAEQEKPKDNLVNKVDKYFEKKCKKLDNVIKLHDYKKLSKQQAEEEEERCPVWLDFQFMNQEQKNLTEDKFIFFTKQPKENNLDSGY